MASHVKEVVSIPGKFKSKIFGPGVA